MSQDAVPKASLVVAHSPTAHALVTETRAATLRTLVPPLRSTRQPRTGINPTRSQSRSERYLQHCCPTPANSLPQVFDQEPVQTPHACGLRRRGVEVCHQRPTHPFAFREAIAMDAVPMLLQACACHSERMDCREATGTAQPRPGVQLPLLTKCPLHFLHDGEPDGSRSLSGNTRHRSAPVGTAPRIQEVVVL